MATTGYSFYQDSIDTYQKNVDDETAKQQKNYDMAKQEEGRLPEAHRHVQDRAGDKVGSRGDIGGDGFRPWRFDTLQNGLLEQLRADEC